MGFTIGTAQSNNLPLTFRYFYGGAEVAWTQPYRINSLSNSAEAIDGKYRISDLDFYLMDPNGSYFATQFGRGTNGFGSTVQLIACVGGTMEYQTQGINTVFKKLGTAGAYVATVHTGRVYQISYADRLLRIRSKNALALLSEMAWQFPIEVVGVQASSIYGSLFFKNSNLRTTYRGTTAFFDYSNGRQGWKCVGYNIGTDYGGAATLAYPAMSGRGTVSIDSNFYFAGTDAGGTNFYQINDFMKLDGSYLGSYFGTISELEEANEFGFQTVGDAEVAKQSLVHGTFYPINKTRFKANIPFTGSYVYLATPLTISGTPKECYELLVTGAMVTPYFSTSDLESTTLSEYARLTAYNNFSKTIELNKSKVFDSIKEVLDETHAIFSVNTSNKFEVRGYGPQNLQATLPEYGTGSLISSEFHNLEEDYYNRIVVKYKWNYIDENFGSQHEQKTSRWAATFDRPLVIESKWISNSNEAAALADRTRQRYDNTLPHIIFKTNLNHLGLDIGTLIRITDPNSGATNKVVQITGYEKDWEDRTISWTAYDGEALFGRRGYAFWMTGSPLPGNAVSGTSTSGWGASGTVPNINSAIYGSTFSWW